MTLIPLVSLWAKRSLIFQMALMNIKIRYKATQLGIIWTILEPTLLFILLYVVFTSIRDRPQENFAIYLLTGVIIYHIFTRGTLAGLTSLSGNRGILQSLNIRREFFPVVSTTATCLLIFVEVATFMFLLPFFDFIPTWTIVFLPIVLGLLVLLILGFSYFLSILHVYFKDIQPFWGILIHALFFVTPIIWYLEDADQILLDLHKINPIGQLVELGHKIVVFGEVPLLEEWLYAGIFAFGFFIVGYLIFQKFEERIVEEL